MGVVGTIRNGIVKKAGAAATKAADGIAKVSQLSPEQVRQMDDKREKYLTEMPSSDDAQALELTRRVLGAISIEVNEAYLTQISRLYLPIEEKKSFDVIDRIAYFQICKWAKDPDEDNIEKLMNVYQVLSEEDCNIALIYHRTKDSCSVYLAVVNNGVESDPSEVSSYRRRLIGAIRGNFPGAQLRGITDEEENIYAGLPDCLDFEREDSEHNPKSVAIVSNLVTEKTEKFASQTIEKVLDGIVPQKKSEEYTIVLLATPIWDTAGKKDRLYELYSALVPYANWQTNYQVSESDTQGSSGTVAINVGVGAGTQQSTSQSVSQSDQQTISTSEGKTVTLSEGKSESSTVGGSGGIHVDGKIGPVKIGGSASGSYSKTNSKSRTMSAAKTWTKTLARTVGKTVTEATSKGTNFGVNAGASFARSSNASVTMGRNEGIVQNFMNYGIKHTLEILEQQVGRLEQSEALGLWDFAAYVISENSDVANNVAHTYLALTQGEESFLSEAAVNLWRGDLPEYLDTSHAKDQTSVILQSIAHLQHPEFCLSPHSVAADLTDNLMYPSVVSATVSMSGKELARALNFPGKSVNGMPVLETASFGRSVSSYNQLSSDLRLGQVYHMHMEESNVLMLSKDSLTSHMFVTGSTGAGKTNTVVQLLKRLTLSNYDQNAPKFMVVEPAKGEYRDLIGGYDGVSVYGTNPKLSALLQINPFSFPENISVSEHIDRLVEIFNVCWPMYAAMPAILKDAVIRAYEEAGWDLNTSENRFPDPLYPCFRDVMEQIRRILNSSEYSSDTKGDYTGALVARLKSLTLGINGQIFTPEGLTNQELFEQNVIIDLSRVGSTETKSLIMGLMVLKLQEYCLSDKRPDSTGLRHITVLEEAHNLLRRTSLEQSSESANLLGKSVEMLTNAIAELRAFGESFIIADQAPGLLDTAVIRNTNTKIVHRLPEQEDREIVGKAMGMNDAQIRELTRLEMGVAAVFQNNWIEPVLCKVDEFKSEDQKAAPRKTGVLSSGERTLKNEIINYLISCAPEQKGEKLDLDQFKGAVLHSQLPLTVKTAFFDYLQGNNEEKLRSVCKIVYELSETGNVVELAQKCDNIYDWVHFMSDKMKFAEKGYSNRQIDLALALILCEQAERNPEYNNLFCRFMEVYRSEGKVF